MRYWILWFNLCFNLFCDCYRLLSQLCCSFLVLFSLKWIKNPALNGLYFGAQTSDFFRSNVLSKRSNVLRRLKQAYPKVGFVCLNKSIKYI